MDKIVLLLALWYWSSQLKNLRQTAVHTLVVVVFGKAPLFVPKQSTELTNMSGLPYPVQRGTTHCAVATQSNAYSSLRIAELLHI